MKTLFRNIKQLIQVREDIYILKGKDMGFLPVLDDAYLVVQNDLIEDYGLMKDLDDTLIFDQVIDAKNKLILPTWVDSHTHFVFAENRSQEFVDRIKGLSYQEITNKGGGILNSAEKLNLKSEDDLYEEAKQRLHEAILCGTGAIEIKSGYGLSLDGELKMLRVIKRLKSHFKIPIKSTFLGAHALPKTYHGNHDKFVDDIVTNYLPIVAKDDLADYFDMFLETNYFSTKHAEKLLSAAQHHGLQSKIHVNQFTSIGGIKVACDHQALTVDHLEILTPDDCLELQKSQTIPVALPLCSLFLEIPYTPAREILNHNLPLVIATDYNPGTAPSHQMNLAMALGCIKMKLTPEESLNACTHNAAFAIELQQKIGSITKGKKANFIITKPLNHYNDLPYLFSNNIVDQVYIDGELFQ